MGLSFFRDSSPLTPKLLSFLLAHKSFFTWSAAVRTVLAAAGRGLANMAKENSPPPSSLPPSIRPYLVHRPREPHGLSPTASSPGAQDEAEIPAPATFQLPSVPSLVPPTHQAAFPDARRQYPNYESGVHDPVSSQTATGLIAPERLGGPSSIPHGSTRRYRSPVVSDPIYPSAVRQQGPSAYPGSHSLPALSQITGHWREGEAGPSSLVHSHQYDSSRRHSPNYLQPQPIHRRATEPGNYSSEGTHVQPALHSSYERLREFPEGYPPRSTSEFSYGEVPQSWVSRPPVYARSAEWPHGTLGSARAGEPLELAPIYSQSIQSQASISSDLTRIEDGESNPRKRKASDDFGTNTRPIIPKKILVACDFCRGRKLKCDGDKPTCSNCRTRRVTCLYRLQPKRRGPGKAAKGSRTKKRVPKTGRQSEFSLEAAQDPNEHFDMQTIAPELRSRTSLADSMYSSQSTLVGGRYDSRQPSPEWTPQQRRRPRSRNRTSSSEYYSTPSESESKR
ncbi:hypothetical protein B0H19DRAFT_1107739 [Mycena capillaripes]|nr:hypothetical protein B0H19DRAFT_1107739 [Mycena capillaripes]